MSDDNMKAPAAYHKTVSVDPIASQCMSKRITELEAELAELRRLAEPLAEYWRDRRCVDEDGDECDCDDCFLGDSCPLQDYRARYPEE